MMNFLIQPFDQNDWQDISKIYKEGIRTGIATFETEIPTWKQWDQNHLSFCRFKAIHNEQIWGWIALSPKSKRAVYKGVAEVSVYVGAQAQNRRVGRSLLNHLISVSESHGIWSLQASIFPENKASQHLHASAGFRVIGIRKKSPNIKGVGRIIF
ncbi:GNAT family N-acetyltransferase [Aquimarina intermedia]|uniref:Phosphinothricin acetyltransferase n=1 Tax=Aquimarina intermedia TaxID=350814 RepID=A0A5S5CCD2_9FLAO|nr:GNAT family N-acetyltransferase [Aquimarina intermedia]TYP76162.1 phosphinothricin acetyltransferase [Aquimarina intermedia]